MANSSFITGFGMSLLVIYCLIKIMDFYGVDKETYSIYLIVYILLLLFSYILPTQY